MQKHINKVKWAHLWRQFNYWFDKNMYISWEDQQVKIQDLFTEIFKVSPNWKLIWKKQNQWWEKNAMEYVNSWPKQRNNIKKLLLAAIKQNNE